jgi:hypothetical protein
MLWFLVALQAMTPFIHAHAGAVQLTHASFMHLHSGAQGVAANPALAADESDAPFEVAQGRPLRIDPLGAAHAGLPALPLSPLHAERTVLSGAGLPTPLQPQRVPPAHTHPHALAPPSV